MAKSNYIVRGGGDFSGLYNEFNKAQKRMNVFKSTMTKTMKGLGLALSGLAIGKIVKDSLKAGSELEGAFVGLESILTGQGRSFNNAKNFINEYINDGLIPLTDAITAYKNLAARGYSDEQIQTTLERLKDAAAFGRQSSYTLGEAVKTATEGLKNENSILVDNAGVTKNVSKMWDEYAKTIGKNRNQLTQQEKIQAEVNGIMKETQWQVGDAAKYTDKYAGRVAVLTKTLRDVKINLGQAFMPIANVVLPLLQTLANSLSRATAFIAQFSQALFGKVTKAQAKATQQQANAVGELGDVTEKAGKQAKGAVAGFDEINQIGKNDGGSGEISIGGIATEDITAGIGEGTGGIMEEVSTKAQEMAEKVRNAFTSMKNAIVENKNIIVPAIGAILGAMTGLAMYTGITTLVTNIKKLGTVIKGAWAILAAHPVLLVVAAIGALIGALVGAYKTNDKFRNSVDNLWARIKTALGPAFERLGEIMTWTWQNVTVPFAKFLGTMFVTSLQVTANAARWLHQNILVPLGNLLLWLWNTVLVPVGRVLTDILAVAFDVVASVAKSLWQNVLVPLGSFIGTIFITTIKATIDILKHWWQNTLQPLGNFIITIFKPIVEGLSEVFTFLWQNVLKPLITFMAGTFKSTFETVTKGIGNTINGLKTIFVGLINFITGVFTADWRRAWNGIKDIFKGVFDTLYGIVKVPLNLIIDAINKVISGLNKLSIKIPSWVPGLGGMSWGINIAKIPKLAEGAVIPPNSEFLAILGDQTSGRNIETPEKLLREIMKEELSGTNGSNGDIYLTVQLGEDTIMDKVISNINRKNRISGKTVIKV